MAVLLALAGVALLPAASAGTARADTTITIAPTGAPDLGNCWPFGYGSPSGGGFSWAPTAAFFYKDIPPFNLTPGYPLAFDLNGVNDADIQLDIALARTTANGEVVEGEPFQTVATNTQTPANPRGDNIVGNFELQFAAEEPFAFPGGGLIIRFSNPSPSYQADDFCNGNLVGASSADPSGFFVQRAFQDPDGVAPWGPTATNSIGAFRVTSDETPPETTITNAPTKKVKSFNKTANVLFEFTSSEPDSTFACSLDGRASHPCSSPDVEKVKAKRKTKKHQLAVSATDAAGNADPTPATAEFKVKRKKKKKK